MSLQTLVQATRRTSRLDSISKGHIIFKHVACRRAVSTFFAHPKQAIQPRSPGSSWVFTSRRWATSVTPHSTASDPAEVEALRCLEQGTTKLEEGDVQGAKLLYKRSAEINRNCQLPLQFGSHTLPSQYVGRHWIVFTWRLIHLHVEEYDEAIDAWKESIAIQPPAQTRTQKLHPHSHRKIPEIAFNLAAVLEATGRLEDALTQYQRSKEFGVERAAVHIRNVGQLFNIPFNLELDAVQ
ncbi:hypothetical protein FPV67DRAFT_1727513 [Lyophyllum atratum]|nr:hypothetical protein FPV67DRAFT_1727513 [Lyophyllum atratum]